MQISINMEKKTVKDVPNKVIGSLADGFGKSVDTIKRWFTSGNLILTTPKATEIFEKEGFSYNPEEFQKS